MRNSIVIVGCGCLAMATMLAACGSSDDSAAPQSDAGSDAAQRAETGRTEGSDAGSNDASLIDVSSIDAAIPDVPFCDRLFGGVIKYYDRCCNAAELTRLDAGLADFEQVVDGCNSEFGSGLAKGRLSIDATKEATCYAAADANSNQACTSVQNPNDFFRTVPVEASIEGACSDLYVGQQAVGEPCATSDECKNGLTCIGYIYSKSDGQCEPPPANGETCGAAEDNGGYEEFAPFFGSHPDCVSGFTCSFGKCVPEIADGNACPLDVCVTGDSCVAGICKAPSMAGGSCTVDSECVLPLYCDTLSGGSPGTCKTRNSAGAACDDNGDCLGLCDRPDGGAIGSCIAFCGAP